MLDYIGRLVVMIQEYIYTFRKIKKYRDIERFPLISIKDIKKIKDIEKEAFPDSMILYKDIKTIKQMKKHCSCSSIFQIYSIVTNEWYLLIVDHKEFIEVMDCAAKNKKCSDILKIYNIINDVADDRLILMDCREKTSYLLVKALERGGKVEITSDEKSEFNNEVMHNIVCRIVK